MNKRLQKIGKEVSDRVSRFNLLVEQKQELVEKITKLQQSEKILYEASLLLQEASLFARSKMKGDIEKVVSSALQQILMEPSMRFDIEYKQAHNKIAANFFLLKEIDGKEVKLDIMNECGGGVADIVSLSIRVVLLLYHSRNLSKILLLDEACTSISNFSGEVLNRLGEWLRMVSEKFDIQIILVTQKPELASYAHRSFRMEQDNDGVSHVIRE